MTNSFESLIAAEQQLHLMKILKIDQIVDPHERAQAEAEENERRRQKEAEFSSMQ